MEMILKLTDNIGLFALLVLLMIGALSVLLVLAISAWEVVFTIKKYRKEKKVKNNMFLHVLIISKDETIDRFSLYKRLYADIKAQLIVLGATEDQASRTSNIYCVRYINEIFTEYEAAMLKGKSDWELISRIRYNK